MNLLYLSQTQCLNFTIAQMLVTVEMKFLSLVMTSPMVESSAKLSADEVWWSVRYSTITLLMTF